MRPPIKRFAIRCSPKSPLLAGDRRGAGNLSTSLDFVPGAALRGALARLWPSVAGPAPQYDLFLSGASFPDLTANGATAIPLSSCGCKFGSSFYDPDPLLGRHGIYDLLLDPDSLSLQCHLCGGELKPKDGWMRLDSEGCWADVTVAAQTVGRTAVDRSLRSAAHGLFFQECQIAHHGYLEGELRFEEHRERQVRALLEKASASGIQTGHGKSVGLGDLSLEFYPAAEPEPPLALRMERMQQAYAANPSGHAILTATLQSRAVLLDRYLQPCGSVQIHDVLDAMGDAADPSVCAILQGFHPHRTFASGAWIYGWNAMAGLPRSPDFAIRAGSCFSFVREDQPLSAAEIAALSPALSGLESTGIGERQAEGLGRVAFCDSYHYQGEHARERNHARPNTVLH